MTFVITGIVTSLFDEPYNDSLYDLTGSSTMSELDRKHSTSEHDVKEPHDSPPHEPVPERGRFAKIYYHPLAQIVLLGFILFM